MLGKDIIEEAKRLYDADRKKRQRELRAEKDAGDVPQCPTMSHNVPPMSHNVPKCGNGNGISCITVLNPLAGNTVNTVNTVNTQIQTRTRGKQAGRLPYSSDFLCFWELYPKKVGKDAAYKAWQSRRKDGLLPDLDTIKSTLSWQHDSDQWRKEGGQYIPNPSTYITQARWTDERPETYDERLARETAELMSLMEVRT
jgi:hypothetical protein